MNIPNALSLFRIILTPIFLIQLFSYKNQEITLFNTALFIFIIAALTDALDGFLARILDQITTLGSFLDPLADKLLILSAFLGILFVPEIKNQPPLWATIFIVFREILILSGMMIFYFLSGELKTQPNVLGKLTTAVQMALVILILMQSPYVLLFSYLTISFTIASAISYSRRAFKSLG